MALRYVNYEGAGSYDLPKIRELVTDNFSLWGPIKSIYIVHKKTLAFVRCVCVCVIEQHVYFLC